MSIKFDTLLIELLEDLKETLQEQIDEDKKRLAAPPICEFCETPYNESKTKDCFQCKCMREGRSHPRTMTYRESKSYTMYQCKTCEGLGYEIISDGNCKYCVAWFDSKEEERINKAEERYTKFCIEQDEGGPIYD